MPQFLWDTLETYNKEHLICLKEQKARLEYFSAAGGVFECSKARPL